MLDAQTPDVSVVIVHYETPDLLARCLAAIAASTTSDRLEVWVIDNGSVGFERAAFEGSVPTMTIIENGQNFGFSKASNIGIRAARGRHILLLNPDTIVEADAIERVMHYLDTHPDVGCATARVLLPDGRLDLACRRSFPTPVVAFYRMTLLSRLFPRSRRFGRYNLTYLDDDLQTEIDSPCGAFMMVPATVVARVGLLDEAYFMYGEDLDWAYRIKAGGWRIMYLPFATVHHVKRASSSQIRTQTIAWFYDAMRRFYRTHYESAYPRVVTVAILGSIWLRERMELLSARLRRSRRPSRTMPDVAA